jgi:hypothetical protein
MGKAHLAGRVRSARHGAAWVIATLAIVAGGLVTVTSSATAVSPKVTQITMRPTLAYKPIAPPGATDDYHCTLVNPHVTQNSFIVGSHFYPEGVEVHHAILFLVPPALAAQAVRDDKNGKGWTCFGESPLPGSSFAQVSNTPWLTAWAPGHGQDVEPAGTGVVFPKGSLVVEQIHYNLLQGDAPVRAKLVLDTVPASTPLKPLHLTLLPAPPDLPCPTGVTGPLCNRAASLANTAMRFGQGAVTFVNFLENFCGRSVTNPNPSGSDSTSCTWPVGPGHIVRVTPHMHLTGRGMSVVLNAGTPQAQTLLNVTNYNFDYQRSYLMATPVATKAGDTVTVTCSYDPTLRQKLPQLRKLPARYVTWGDGSSDEMCLAILQSTA